MIADSFSFPATRLTHLFFIYNLRNMAATNFHEITSPSHFQELLSADLNRVSLINFWAPWAAPCEQMNEVVAELAKKYPVALVLQVDMYLFRQTHIVMLATGRSRRAG